MPQPHQPHLVHTGSIDVDTLLLVVVGAHPRAEQNDRPTAYRLRQRMLDWIERHDGLGEPGAEGRACVPLVCSDVWYLNDKSLRECAAVSIGGPGVNAFSAYLGDKLPSAFVIDDVFMVQMDVELAQTLACCWGTTHEGTAGAVEAFSERYLDHFMRAATGLGA